MRDKNIRICDLKVRDLISLFQPEKAMGMVHYAEKTVFTAGKNAGEKENKEDQVDEAWKPKISLVCAIRTLDMQMEIDVYIKPIVTLLILDENCQN